MSSALSSFWVQVLGPFVLYQDGVPVDTRAWQRTVLTLLKLLVVAPDGRRLRDEVVEVLWPDASPDAGASNLRYVVSVLRRHLGGGEPAPILLDRNWIALNPERDWQVDLSRFLTLAETSGDDVIALEQAAGLYRGEPLVEDRYEDWAAPVREHTIRLCRDVYLRLATLYRGWRGYEDAAKWYEKALGLDPLDEDALRALLVVLGELGKRTEALRRYRQFEERLRAEIGVSPEPETLVVVDELRRAGGEREPERAPEPVHAAEIVAAADGIVREAEQAGRLTAEPFDDADGEAMSLASAAREPVDATRPTRSRWTTRAAAAAAAALVLVVTVGAITVTLLRGSTADLHFGRSVAGWGSSPAPSGVLQAPAALAFDARGNVYVTDAGANRVLEYSADGVPLMQWGRKGDLSKPGGLAVDGRGNIYVADTGHDRVLKFASTGRLLATWGTAGDRPGQFLAPSDVAIDGHGRVLVVDGGNNLIQILSPAGKTLSEVGRGALTRPVSLVLDAQDHIYVADAGNVRIVELDERGTLLNSWPLLSFTRRSLQGLALDRQGDFYFISSFGNNAQEMSRDGQVLRGDVGPAQGPRGFRRYSDIAVDPAGYVYLADFVNGQVLRFSPTARLLHVWGRLPYRGAGLQSPQGVAVDRNGDVLVADTAGGSIWKFSHDGVRAAVWSLPRAAGRVLDPSGIVAGRTRIFVTDWTGNHILVLSRDGKLLHVWGGRGTSALTLANPSGLALDTAGNLYVADTGTGRIVKISPAGAMLASWNNLDIYGGGASGSVLGDAPSGLAIDSQGNVFVTDALNDHVDKLSPTGVPLAQWGRRGSGPGRLRSPQGIAVDARGNVYVADTANNRIQIFSSAGKLLARVGGRGSGPGRFLRPWSIALDSHGNVYVADTGNDRVQKFTVAR